MSCLWKEKRGVFGVWVFLFILFVSIGVVEAGTLYGTVRHNGSIMPLTTTVFPDYWVYDFTDGVYLTKGISFSYDTKTGEYSLDDLPAHQIGLTLVFHVRGSTRTLPGNYWGSGSATIPVKFPYSVQQDIDEEQVMHMTEPWDNDAIDSGSRYKAHTSPVHFQWDSVSGANEYRFVVTRYRDSDHPSGWGYIDTAVDVRLLGTSFTPSALALSQPDEHYQAWMEAFNMKTGEKIAHFMVSLSSGGYGWDYRFKVVPVHYGPWHVDKDATGDYRDGSDWEHAFDNIHDALNAASAGQQIRVAHDTYKPDEGGGRTPGDRSASFTLKTGVVIFGGYAGFGEPNPDARDIELFQTILSGDIGAVGNDSDNSYHVLIGNGTEPSAVLDGFTVTGGNANSSSPNNGGGGMRIDLGSPTVFNCTFISNSASRGGAISNMGYTAGHPTFRNCMFFDNSSGAGGAVESQGGEPRFTNCLFSGNSSESGGALFNMGNSNTTMVNCTLSRNSAASVGGAIYNSWATAGVELLNCILWENSDTGGMDESAQINVESGGISVNYSCIQGWTGGFGGTDNIGGDPMHVDPDGLDDVLGTVDDNVRLSLGSPAINTGHPALLYNDLDGSRNDMGVYGGPWADPTGGSGLLPGSGFLFTTVGNIPTSFITEDHSDPAAIMGTANVDPTGSSNYSIPAYTNSPFGSKIRLHGLFGSVDDVDYYQVLIAGPWDGVSPLSSGDFTELDDKLYKTWSWWNAVESKWDDTSLKVGPLTVRSQDNMYFYTTDGFWSHLDLRLILDTRRHSNGLYKIQCKGYRDNGSTLVDVTPGNAKDLIIRIDNSPVTARIDTVRYDEDSPEYISATDGEIPGCAIILLEDAEENLRFNITASHPNGSLRYWVLDTVAGKNDHRGKIASESYSPTPDPLWFANFEPEYRTENAPAPPSGLQDWIRCAYQFRLRAYSRITNGYGYIYWSQFSDHYFLDLGGTTNCGTPDIDGSGRIDFGDLSIIADHWMETY